MKAKQIIFGFLILTMLNCKVKDCYTQSKSIEGFDINRYTGTWYEIARMNHKFERGLVGVTATYTLQKNGFIKVVNSGYKDSLNGVFSKIEGKAKIPNPKCQWRLKVSFFWFFYADYIVLDIDENYQWAIVGSNSKKYLWILSRKPQVDDIFYQELLDKAQKLGYDINQLIKVPQKQ